MINKANGAFVVLCVIFSILAWLKHNGTITDITFTTLVGAIIVVMGALLNVALRIGKDSISTDPVKEDKRTLPSKTDDHEALFLKNHAFGLAIDRIHSKHKYLSSFDFDGVFTYSIENVTEHSLVDMIPDSADWAGSDITYELNASLEGNESSFHSIESSDYKINHIDRGLDGNDHDMCEIHWRPKLRPSLEPGKKVEYSVNIKTQKTESEAFGSGGSFAGMSSPYYINTLSSEIEAPESYRFINRGYIVKDRTGKEVKVDIDPPRFIEEDRKIVWNVEKPTPTLIYLVKIEIIKDN